MPGKNPQKNQTKKKTKADLFLELAKPDSQGFSRAVPVSEFKGKYAGLKFGNGGSWARDDGTGLARKYNVVRNKQGGSIVSVELQGDKKNPILKVIRKDIKDYFKGERCVVLDIGKTECDHKDGRRDDPRLNDPNQQKIEDFQPLSKAANVAKREQCSNAEKQATVTTRKDWVFRSRRSKAAANITAPA